MLAAELSQGGWPSFGAFRWSDIGGGPATVLAEPAEVLTGATDEITDALDTAADVLRRRLSG
jgi:hypothetical protein